MKLNLIHLLFVLLFSGCLSQKNILSPISNDGLKIQSENWIDLNIPEKYHKHFLFVGAYSGIQCETEVKNTSDFSLEHKTKFSCTCYNYELKTKQNQKLYLGTNSMAYLWSKICFDSENEIIEEPNKEHILAATKHLDNRFLSENKVDSLTKSKIEEKTKLGRFPKLIYRSNEDKVFWEVIRYKGWLNVSLYEFKIDAISGEIIRTKKTPYRRTFWQWFSGFKY